MMKCLKALTEIQRLSMQSNAIIIAVWAVIFKRLISCWPKCLELIIVYYDTFIAKYPPEVTG